MIHLHRTAPVVLLLATAALTAQQWSPIAIAPRYRAGHGMATDPTTNRPLLFGGSAVYNWNTVEQDDNDTWRWNGSAWYRCATTAAPAGIDAMIVAADVLRQRVVLCANSAATFETWEWDGHDWSLLAPANTPPAGTSLTAAMTYDLARGRTVFFDAAAAETWEWDGSNWSQVVTANAPNFRLGAKLTYDLLRGRSVLFGGDDGSRQHHVFNDTWEYDGIDWTQATPLANPPGRNEYALTWDGARQLVMLFGGRAGSSLFADTWYYDGVTWTQQLPATTPPPQVEQAMAFDAVSGHVVLFTDHDGIGGAVPETWEWDGNNWVQSPVPPVPSVRMMHGFADDAHGRMLLFGGYNAAFSGLGPQAFGDTWLFDGSHWLPQVPVNAPSARAFFALATDTARQRVVLFGGEGNNVWANDTWEWDGSNWLNVSNSGPTARSRSAMAFDGARNVCVLHGGNDANGQFGDTWLWDGTQWLPTVGSSPSARSDHAMTFDTARNVVVMFGGQDFATSTLNDLWEWNGTQWTQRAATTPPAPRAFHDFTFDRDRNRYVLHGGAPTIDTWEWDGASSWTQITAGNVVGTATAPAFAWDSRFHRVLGFDGSAIWAYSTAQATASAYGNGCGNFGFPELSSNGRPFVGNPVYGFEVLGAPGGSPCLLFLDFAAASTPFPGGCTILLQNPRYFSLAFAGNTGSAEFALPVPANPSLQSLSLFIQVGLIDPIGGIGMTNGVHLHLGN